MTASIWAPNGFAPDNVPTETYEFSATSGQTTFSIAPYTSISQDQLQVFKGAMSTSAEILRNNQWSVVGTNVVLTVPAGVGDYVRIVIYTENPTPDGGIPSQSGNAGRALSTTGSALRWVDFPQELPSQLGQGGKFLITDGFAPSWATVTGGGGFKYQFTGTGYTSPDQYAAFMAYYNSIPEGNTLFIDGIVSLTTPLVLNRRIHIICPSSADGFWSNVGAGADAITFQGNAAGLNNLMINIFLYGPASSCRHGIVFSRLDRSRVYANVRTGASNFAFVSDGCLINQFDLQSSTNYTPPSAVSGWGTQRDHLLVQKNVAYSVASNINTFMVNFEGCRNGIVSTAQSGEGGNVYKGVIEGLSGAALSFDSCAWAHITDIWLEANGANCTFNACDGLKVGPGVYNQGAVGDLVFTNCKGLDLDHYYGGYSIASSCVGSSIRVCGTPDPARNICNDVSAVQSAFLNSSTLLTSQYGTTGAPSLENVYSNPYFDIWADVNPATSAPRGVTAGTGGALVNRITSPVYPGNPNIYSLRATSGATGSGNLCTLTLSFTPGASEWYSVFLPVYVPAGQPGVIVHIANGTSSYVVGVNTATKNTWLEFRGSAPAIAGQPLSITISGWDGSTFANSQVYLGGCNIVRGPIPPKALGDHGRRRANIIGTIANAPDFVGQIAKIPAGDLYMANDTAGAANWLKTSP